MPLERPEYSASFADLPEHSASFSDLPVHSASFSDLLDPYYNPRHQHSIPSESTSPMAQTQIGLYHHSPSNIPIAQTQIGQLQHFSKPQLTSQLRSKPTSRARNVPNSPYPKPILKKTAHVDHSSQAQSSDTPTQTKLPSRRRVSLVMSSAGPSQMHHGTTPVGPANNSDIDSEEDLIRKPDGEAGRPKRGGYTLRRQSANNGIDSEEDLIRKPDGEAGRPKRGGYTLRRQLNWKGEQYRKINVCSLDSCHMSYSS